MSVSITCNYGIPPGGSWETLTNSVAAETPGITVSWATGRISVPIDIDLKAYPLTNSAGDAVEKHRDIVVDHLTITRPEPFYDYERLRKFADTVNAKDWRVSGSKTVIKAGEAFCTNIHPAEPYPPTTSTVIMAYSFDIIQIWKLVGTSDPKANAMQRVSNPWRVLQAYKDLGSTGWASVGDTLLKGPLYYSTGAAEKDVNPSIDKIAVGSDVPLDGTGRPIDPNIMVGIATTGGVKLYAAVSPKPPLWPPSQLSENSNEVCKIVDPTLIPEMDFYELKL